MANGFRPVDRDQQFLLPVDMREWLPDDHVVWVLLELVEHLDLRRLEARYVLGGVGRRAYDPRMMLALLIYAYADGVRSSRQIERLCRTDVARRVICALQVPDHSVIARFRQQHQDSARELFTQVLLVCAKAGLGRLGTIAIDGTKIAANASRGATCRRKWLQEQVDAIIADAGSVDAAEDADRGSEIRDGETSRQLRGRLDRNERVRRCLEEVKAEEALRGQDAESIAVKEQVSVARARQGWSGGGPLAPGVDPVAVAAARVEAAREYMQQTQDRKRERIAEVREQLRLAEAGLGPKPNLGLFSFDDTKGREVSRARRRLVRAEGALAEAHDAAAASQRSEAGQSRKSGGHGKKVSRDSRRQVRRNVTDPDSRLMSAADGGAVQGYNAQLVVADDGLILAPELVQDANDSRQFRPMSEAAVRAAVLVHQARCEGKCPNIGGCCVGGADGEKISTGGCGGPACPCSQDWIGVLLLDNGYCNNDSLTAPGPDRLIATGKSRDLPEPGEDLGPLAFDSDARTRMAHRLASPDGAGLYKRRAATVEPVNGHLKDRTGLRRFARRGLAACQAELDFAAMVLNLGKLMRLESAERTAALAG
ncbi:transposase [Kitasatospora sp. NPDC057015]|uniref:transposase n=1 Tax=Kitasatospora sp. NPDC057015 TaxID=3346001 RepID=UPI00363DCF3A